MGRGARLRPGRFVVRIHAGRLLHPRCDVVQSAGRPAVTRRTLVRPQPSQLLAIPAARVSRPAEPDSDGALAPRMRELFIPRSSNGRIFGSEPKDAWFESRPRSSIRTRPWRPSGLQPRTGEGSIPSVRAPRPGLLVDRGCRPLKPATRVRIPLGALGTTRPWCQRQHAGVPCLRCGFEPRRPLQHLP